MVIAILLDLDARRRRRARERIYRTRINVFGMGDSEVYRIFRFNTDAIQEIATALHDDITSQTHMQCSHWSRYWQHCISSPVDLFSVQVEWWLGCHKPA